MNIVISYTICAIVWGTTWYAIRVCIAPGGYPTLPSAAIRFSIAAICLVSIYLIGFGRPGPEHRKQWLWLIFAGLLNAVSYSLVYIAEENISGGLASVLFSTEPIAIAILVTLFHIERVKKNELFGAIIAFVGVIIIFWDRLNVAENQAIGIIFVLVAVFISGYFVIIIKHQAGKINPLASASIFITTTSIVLWIASFVRGWESLPWPPPVMPTVALLYLSIFGSVIAFAVFFYLLKRISLMGSVTLVFLIPIIALIVDAFWETEVQLSSSTYIGSAVTLFGVFINFAFKHRQVVYNGLKN
jgi:drug/metabolite transporter (DMT)-like permease